MEQENKNINEANTLKAVLEKHEVNEFQGLTSEQVAKNREKYGVNELEEGKKTPLIVKFLEQFKDVLIVILIIAAIVPIIISAIVEGSVAQEDWIETIIILVVVILNAVLGVFQENKAEKSLEALKKMSQPNCRVLRNGQIEVIPSKDVVVGDIVYVEAGDFIPADCRIIESTELKVDESSLTGESLPVSKNNKDLPAGDLPLGDQKNMIFSSTFATNGKAKAVVLATGMNTEIGKIASMLQTAKKESTPLQNKLAVVGKIIGILCLAICAIVFILEVCSGYMNGNQDVADIWLGSFKEAVALAVAAIPEGLAAVVTIVLSIGVQKMVKHNAIVKKLPAVETLGSTNVICSDKTGTLTQNKMTVVKLYQSELKDIKDITNSEAKMLSYFAICCDAKIEGDKRIGDPTELALLDVNNNVGTDITKIKRVLDLPFDSERKMMTTVIEEDGKFVAITKGAPDIVLNLSNNNLSVINNARDKNEEMANNALRVLALATKEFKELPAKEELEKDMTFVGLVGMIDPARPEVRDSIKIAKEAGIRTVMITGDHITTAEAIARDLGILEEGKKAITSQELDKIDDETLAQTIDDYRVFARVAPKDKVRIVDAWQKNDMVVAMTGDGVNDAPALKRADIGCAMGITGTDVSKQAADMILTDDNFSTIVEAVKQGRGIYANIKKCIRFLLSSNIGEVITIFIATIIGMFTPIGTPLLAVQLLWVNLITDSLPAFGLGMEDPEEKVMQDKPRPKKESFFAGHIGYNIFFEGLFIGLITLAAFLIGEFIFDVDNSNIHGHTMAFMTLATAELFHAYNVKSDNTIFTKETFKNKALNIAFIIGIVLQLAVLYIPGLNNVVFQLTPLSIAELGICFALAISTIVFMEIYKLIKRQIQKH